MLKFVVTVPEETDPHAFDVQRREVTVTRADGGSQMLLVEGKGAGESTEFTAAQGESITVASVSVDDVGNRSEARMQAFIVTDTIAPPAPGEVGIRVTEEVPD